MRLPNLSLEPVLLSFESTPTTFVALVTSFYFGCEGLRGCAVPLLRSKHTGGLFGARSGLQQRRPAGFNPTAGRVLQQLWVVEGVPAL
jgi:hypothetical protein